MAKETTYLFTPTMDSKDAFDRANLVFEPLCDDRKLYSSWESKRASIIE